MAEASATGSAMRQSTVLGRSQGQQPLSDEHLSAPTALRVLVTKIKELPVRQSIIVVCMHSSTEPRSGSLNLPPEREKSDKKMRQLVRGISQIEQ